MAMTRSDDQNGIIKLYLAAFLRAPELDGFNYWSGQLAQGQSLQQVAHTIFSLPIVSGPMSTPPAPYPSGMSDTAFVNQIYVNVFGKSADLPGQAYWLGKLSNGLGRGSLVLEMINAGLNTAPGTPGRDYVTNRYFGAQYAVDVQADQTAYIDPAGLAATMSSLSGSADSLRDYSNAINVLAKQGGLGRLRYSATQLEERLDNDGSIAGTLLISLDNDTFKGAIGSPLGKVSNTPAGLTASLTKTSDLTATLSFSGKASKHLAADSIHNLEITFSASDFTSNGAVFIYGSQRSDLEIHFNDVSLSATGAVLSGSGQLPGALVINLATDTLTLNGLPSTLSNGSALSSTLVDVDLSAMAPAVGSKPAATATVNLVGDGLANQLLASAYGGTLEGAGGNDMIRAGAGQDQIRFAIDAARNGLDTIDNFSYGKGGDILNFSAFLNKTGTSHLTAADVASTVGAAWANGDVLSVQGFNLTTTAAIAALFGTVYAAPTDARKAVLISTGLTGDASIWYITNDGPLATLSVVDAAEVQLVGTITNLNNILLLGFDAKNFA